MGGVCYIMASISVEEWNGGWRMIILGGSEPWRRAIKSPNRSKQGGRGDDTVSHFNNFPPENRNG